ncbi:AMP-binding protein [Actinomadura macrotermitis]|uniref:4-chlorobenzoate--CoA ligase n=1 Tax=Actinomadura macrotermitis TaxID=2585200 RepID=A0A7K0BZ51_9ACTN|nr:class I adenylate-forming enzyme family protein [Actinomadura macrotermitis]MQY06459.1 4-chlorobenzoate--CoA ligase [Actinomadura macrotermitis]
MLSQIIGRLTAGRSFDIGRMFADAAARDPRTPVVLDRPLGLAPQDGTGHTVDGLARRVEELAAALSAAGVRPRERVAVHKTNNFDIVLLACAISRLGAIPALLAPPLPADVVDRLLRRLDRPWLVTDGATLDGAWAGRLPEAPTRGVLLSAGEPRDGVTVLAPRPGTAAPPAPRPGPREPALITHSSGTTGVPKLAVHCPSTLWNRLVPQLAMAWPIRRREPAALCMTFVHSRFYHALGVFLRLGNPLLVALETDPEAVAPLFTRVRPGYVETHPNVYIEWEKMADAPDSPLASVRVFGGTFDAIHPRTVQRLLHASRRARPLFFQLYGQAETGPLTARVHTRRGAAGMDARLVGFALPGFTRVRATGPDGRPVRHGEPGHLEARSRGRIIGYFGEDDRFAAQLNDGWWRLGDLGAVDRRGRVSLLDREIDKLAAVPSNLHAEDLLMERLPELREVVIVEGPDGVPLPVVCTEDDRPLDTARWDQAARDLAGLAAPLHLPFDEVPRTSTWKVQRRDLEQKLAGTTA